MGWLRYPGPCADANFLKAVPAASVAAVLPWSSRRTSAATSRIRRLVLGGTSSLVAPGDEPPTGIAGVASFGTAGAAVTGSENVTVTDVVDGDTLDIRYENGSTDTVRLLGIDTPETSSGNQPYEYEGVPSNYFGSRCLDDKGEDALAFLTDRLEGEMVTLYTGEGTDNRSAVYWGRSSEAWTGDGTVSLTAGGGELATTQLYNESGVVANSD